MRKLRRGSWLAAGKRRCLPGGLCRCARGPPEAHPARGLRLGSPSSRWQRWGSCGPLPACACNSCRIGNASA